jgi:hypothetical protein
VYQRFDRLLEEEEPEPHHLICVAVYKVGALEVKRRLEGKVQVKRLLVLCRECRKTSFDEAELAAEGFDE